MGVPWKRRREGRPHGRGCGQACNVHNRSLRGGLCWWVEGVGQARSLSSNSYARQRRGGDRGGKVRSGHGAAATDAAYTSTNAAPTAAQTAAVASIKAAAASTATATATAAAATAAVIIMSAARVCEGILGARGG